MGRFSLLQQAMPEPFSFTEPEVQALLERYGRQEQAEAFYHAFVLGLLVSLERTHSVRSNREASLRRVDVLLTPKQVGQPGVVLEFKKKERSLESAAEAALQQIQDRRYADELVAMGASPIHLLGIAFSGKDVVVRASGYPHR